MGRPKKVDTYKLTLKSLGRIYRSEGKTLEDAMNKLKLTGGAKATCLLVVEKGDRRVERIFNGNYAQKIFGQVSPTMRAIGYAKAKQFIGI